MRSPREAPRGLTTDAASDPLLEIDGNRPLPWWKSMYGRRYLGALRATFVIAPDGIVAHVIPRVTPRTHDDEVLAVLEQLAAA